MKRGVNLLWLCYVFLVVALIVVSTLDGIKYIPTYYEGLPMKELSDGTIAWHDISGNFITLPEPTFFSLVDRLLPGCIICILMFFPKKKLINAVGCIVAAFQCVVVACSGKVYDWMLDKFDSTVCAIGELHGYHELTVVGRFTLVLSLSVFVFSILLTCSYARD